MKKNHQGNTFTRFPSARLFSIFSFFCILLLCSRAEAKFRFDKSDSDTAEKKVDYIEEIYFSGGNKAQLAGKIQATTQKLNDKSTTLSVAKQYAFLKGIEQAVENAGDACDVEEMLAAGIYSIDANEAMLQGIPKPGKKATKSADGALSAVNNLSKTASDAAWSGWYLSNGSISGFGAASKLGAAASTLNVASSAFNTLKKLTDLFPKADKPCKEVKAKAIEIGSHVAPATPPSTATTTPNATPVVITTTTPSTITTAETKLTIKSCVYKNLQAIVSSIEKIPGVTAASTSSYSNNTAIITIASALKPTDLVGKIMEANKTLKMEVDSLGEHDATLILKS